MRFTLIQLLLLTTFTGFSLFVLLRPTLFMASAVYSATCVILLFAILRAILVNDMYHRFWMGFATCGWCYLCLAHLDLNFELQPPLVTTHLLYELYDIMERPTVATPEAVRPPPMPDDIFGTGDSDGDSESGFDRNLSRIIGGTFTLPDYPTDFLSIGHSLCTILLAWLAGHLTGILFKRDAM